MVHIGTANEFVKHGHTVYIVSAVEADSGPKYIRKDESSVAYLLVRTGRIQKTSVIKKGINTVLLGRRFMKSIRCSFPNVRIDLLIYSTPPISLVGVVDNIKRNNQCKTYLLLKDIFPQNAVDLGMLRTNGVRGLIYKYFRRQEKKLYKVSDLIGCMSKANTEYIIAHNPDIDPSSVEECPNSIEVRNMSVDKEARDRIRAKYNLPLDKKVFVYGGNLGKPQGISFMIECLKKSENLNDAYFLIIGDGTEAALIKKYIDDYHPRNVCLLKQLPKETYDAMVGACDIGMIFLDHRFTIPNFPSRLLAYMQAELPVFAITDTNSDIGKVITEGGFGWWSESNDVDSFINVMNNILSCDLSLYGNRGFVYLERHYDVKTSAELILKHIENT